MKIFKTKNLVMFAVIVCLTFILGACSKDDDPKPKQIYGTYSGSVHYQYTSLSTGELTKDGTLPATLNITQSSGKMNLSIASSENFSYTLAGLPDIKVSGSSSYSYTYKSNDGNINLSIESPDFNKITVTASSVEQDRDIRVDLTFNGEL